MNIDEIKTIEDVYKFMDNIEYGWKDDEGNLHINNMKDFRKKIEFYNSIFFLKL